MILRVLVIACAVLALTLLGVQFYYAQIANPRAAREIKQDPDGERARKVMLVTLPSGREIPVNYWRDEGFVYAGADGRWWKELVDDGAPVQLFLRGRELRGHGRAVVDDPEYRKRIFDQLRPNAIEGFGTLVEIRLEPEPGEPTEPKQPKESGE